MKFNGSSDFASAPLHMFAAAQITVAFWLNWTTFANADNLALEYSVNTNSNDGTFLFDPNSGVPQNGLFQVAQHTAAGTNVGFTRPSAGVWHHYAAAMSSRGTTGIGNGAGYSTQGIFVDGKLVTTNPNGGASVFFDYTLYVMSRAGTSLFGNGAMADLCIFPFVVSQPETLLLTSGFDPRFVRQGPMYYWTLSTLKPESSLGTHAAIMTPSGGSLVPGPPQIRPTENLMAFARSSGHAAPGAGNKLMFKSGPGW
jgi:hypothetical protein